MSLSEDTEGPLQCMLAVEPLSLPNAFAALPCGWTQSHDGTCNSVWHFGALQPYETTIFTYECSSISWISIFKQGCQHSDCV